MCLLDVGTNLEAPGFNVSHIGRPAHQSRGAVSVLSPYVGRDYPVSGFDNHVPTG